MIGDQIKAATLLGAFVVHEEYVPDPGYPPLGTPEFSVRLPVDLHAVDHITISPLWKDASRLIDDIYEEGVDYADDQIRVCAALADDLQARVDRVRVITAPSLVATGDWFRILPGKPVKAYIMPDSYVYVDVLTAATPKGPWVPLPTVLPLYSVIALQGVTNLYVCAKLNQELDEGGMGRWARNMRGYGDECASLWEDHKPPQIVVDN